MQCYESLTPIYTAKGTAVALGYFDGVHLGHRKVLHATQEIAAQQNLDSAVFTFRLPHSGGAGKGRTLLTETEKQRRVQQLGIAHYFCPAFESFCALSPQQFVDEILVQCLGAKHVLCGEDFTFGAAKSGTVPLLKTLCAAQNIAVHIVHVVESGGAPVSSTRIRACLEAGDIEQANALLGQEYRLDLPVQHGKRLGRTLGFPTINQIYPPHMLMPKSGVYITQVRVNGAWLPGATGLGTRPTVSGEGVTCETFIPGFTGDVYGEQISVRFCHYLKPTQRFETLDALKEYIQSAAAAALDYFKK